MLLDEQFEGIAKQFMIENILPRKPLNLLHFQTTRNEILKFLTDFDLL
jgi:hypothetical protein